MVATALVSSAQLDLFKGRASGGEFLRRQNKLLQRCVKQGLDLAAELVSNGLDYDDLRYELDFDELSPQGKYFKLEDFRRVETSVPVVSFFSGCGGLDLGFEAAGFQQIASVEVNKLFCETLRLNRPNWKIIGPPQTSGDVSDREGTRDRLRNLAGIKRRFDGIFIGGPPCQPFSIAANQRFSRKGKNFKRIGYAHKTHGNLLFDYIWLIVAFRPRAFLIENVTGLADIDGGDQFKEAMRTLVKSGYTVRPPLVLNAARYRVPQNRHRLFIVGSLTGKEFHPPLPDSISLSCGKVLTIPVKDVPNHETRKHKAESILRYARLGFGQRDPLGRVDRLDPRFPSKTVIAGGTAGGGRSHLHPHIPRTLSVRECARLQTFPDDFVFQGPPARQFTQVGNAVPPILAVQLATRIMQDFFG